MTQDVWKLLAISYLTYFLLYGIVLFIFWLCGLLPLLQKNYVLPLMIACHTALTAYIIRVAVSMLQE